MINEVSITHEKGKFAIISVNYVTRNKDFIRNYSFKTVPETVLDFMEKAKYENILYQDNKRIHCLFN